MKSAILITAYPNNQSKLDNLQQLLSKLKELDYDICLSSHIAIPPHIVSLCNYYIYDSSNDLYFDPEVKYWNSTIIDKGIVEYKDLIAPSTHIVPYFKDIFNGLNHLKVLGYDKVHYFDYDIQITNTQEIKDNNELLNEYDLICYEIEGGNKIKHNITTYIAFNLKKIFLSKIKHSSEKIIESYKEYFHKVILPVTENILFDKHLPSDNILKKDVSVLEDSFVLHTEFISQAEYTCLVQVNDIVHFFHHNVTHPDQSYNNFDLVIQLLDGNLKVETINIPYEGATLFNLGESIDNIQYVKIYKNGSLLRFLDFYVKEDLEMVTKWAHFLPS